MSCTYNVHVLITKIIKWSRPYKSKNIIAISLLLWNASLVLVQYYQSSALNPRNNNSILKPTLILALFLIHESENVKFSIETEMILPTYYNKSSVYYHDNKIFPFIWDITLLQTFLCSAPVPKIHFAKII